MKIQKFNKLIRDQIAPDLEKRGIRCITKQLDDSEMPAVLDKKLIEEVLEFLEAEDHNKLEEGIDIITVVQERLGRLGYSQEKIADAVIAKVMVKGGFDKNTFLIRTEEYEKD